MLTLKCKNVLVGYDLPKFDNITIPIKKEKGQYKSRQIKIHQKKLFRFILPINFCIPESFNTNISHHLFDYNYPVSVNSQHQNTNSKGDIGLKNRLEMFVLKIMLYKNISDSDFV